MSGMDAHPGEGSLNITAVKVQAKNKNRVNIFVDGAYYDALLADVALQAGLKPGKVLTEDEFIEIKTVSQGKMAFQKAADYIARQTRCTQQVRQYLVQRDYPPEAIEYAVTKLLDYGYVDDMAFARALCHSRSQGKRKGTRYIAGELKKFRIDPDIIQQVLEEIDPDDQLDNARHLAAKYYQKYQKVEDRRQRQQKVAAALARQGYGWDIIRRVVDEGDE